MIRETVPRKTFPFGCCPSQHLRRPPPGRSPISPASAWPGLRGPILPRAQRHIPALPLPAPARLLGG